MFYILIGRLLSIESLVSASLVITGGLWSYLSIEISKLKELRSEYIKGMEDIEKTAIDIIKQAPIVFYCLYNIGLYRKSDELKERSSELQNERTNFAREQNLLVYKIMKVEGSRFDNPSFKGLHVSVAELAVQIDNWVTAYLNESLNITKEDEYYISDKGRDIMKEMTALFSNLSVDFEVFSDSYLTKKYLCLSVVLSCILVVFFKAIF